MNREEYLERAVEMAMRGEDHPHALLTEAQVKEIKHAAWQRKQIRAWVRDNVSEAALCRRHGLTRRKLWEFRNCVTEIKQAKTQRDEMNSFVSQNLTNAALAKRFNVSQNTIDSIVRGLRWVHVDTERGVVHRRPALQNLQGSRQRAS